MTPSPVNLQEKFTLFSEQWTPKIIAQLNDYHLKLVKVQGDFIWHSHAETDEVFMVIDGELTIEMHDGNVTLRPGELYVVPSGVAHRPRAEAECQLLLIEPAGTVNTGDAGGDLTAPADDWI